MPGTAESQEPSGPRDTIGSPTWTRRDAEANRARLIEAAAEVFGEQGLGVTMDRIASHAGLSVGTIYRNFPSKPLLVEAVFAHRGEQFTKVALDADAHEDPWAGVVAFVEGMVSLVVSDRGLRDVFMSTRDGAEGISRTRAEYGPAVEQLLTRAKATGGLRPDVERSDLFMATVMVEAVHRYTETVDPDQWRRCLAIVMAGLRDPHDDVDGASDDAGELPGAALRRDQLEDAMRTAADRR